MTIVSMAAVHHGLRLGAHPSLGGALYRTVLMPVLGAFGLMFGIWYIGLG